jgi:hypothetical protein
LNYDLPMRTWTCICGGKLFFGNTVCTACSRAVGWCEPCGAVVGLDPHAAQMQCGNGHVVVACANLQNHNVCNRFRSPPPPPPPEEDTVAVDSDPEGPRDMGLCRACGMNRTVPDQSVPENRAYWARLEAAKRRMLYDLQLLGLGVETLPASVTPLVFEFMTDSVKDVGTGRWYRVLDGTDDESVYTGHADGVITIHLKEADPVEREATRVEMGERQRSLVGHFRHEVGHYFWDVLVRGDPEREAAFVNRFGDHRDPPYADAMKAYYANGPAPDWGTRCVSAYASMHPWEDWAETWSVYLHLAGTLDTLRAHGWGTVGPPFADFDAAIGAYAAAAVVENELARDRGQLALVPEVMTMAVREKLALVHRLVSEGPRMK